MTVALAHPTELIEAARPGPDVAHALAVLADWLAERDRPEAAGLNAALAHPALTPIGLRRFAGGSYDVPLFRLEPLARAIGLPAPSRGGIARAADVELALLPPLGHDGLFFVGSPDREVGRNPEREKRHRLWFDRPILIGRTTVSQRVYDATGGDHDPYDWVDALQPANRLAWHDATSWCANHGLRLPAELEWEFAARGGSQTPYHFGAKIDGRVNCARRGNAGRVKTVPVGSLPANAFGLFEVHGNLCEWVADSFTYDPRGIASGHPLDTQLRVLRGGSCGDPASCCRAAYRRSETPGRRGIHLGFRPALTLAADG